MKKIKFLSLILLFLGLQSCGQVGPLYHPDESAPIELPEQEEELNTSRSHGCGIYNELIFVDSKPLKQARSKLRNCLSNTAYRQKSTDRNLQPWPRGV